MFLCRKQRACGCRTQFHPSRYHDTCPESQSGTKKPRTQQGETSPRPQKLYGCLRSQPLPDCSSGQRIKSRSFKLCPWGLKCFRTRGISWVLQATEPHPLFVSKLIFQLRAPRNSMACYLSALLGCAVKCSSGVKHSDSVFPLTLSSESIALQNPAACCSNLEPGPVCGSQTQGLGFKL